MSRKPLCYLKHFARRPQRFTAMRLGLSYSIPGNARRLTAIRYTASMGILIGMDEAGYGPNFGPLVVAATAWQCVDHGEVTSVTGSTRRNVAEKVSAGTHAFAESNPQSAVRNPKSTSPDLYRLLRTVVSKSPNDRRIAIADSKALYSPGLGLRQLERGVHSVLRSIQQPLTRWSEFIGYCQADAAGHHAKHCWPGGHDCPLPIDTTEEELSRLESRFTRACESAQVRPLMIRARLVFPAEFNELVERYNTKGAALSHITVGLLREVMEAVSSLAPRSPLLAPTQVVCDKHGGRNFYAALLQHHFSEHWIEPVYETQAESRYEFGLPESRTQVSFRMKGERFLPTALASMTAKYLRELSMKAFNAFWMSHIPELRPTAGYPKDAKRFRLDIQTAQRKLGIDDHVLWRNR